MEQESADGGGMFVKGGHFGYSMDKLDSGARMVYGMGLSHPAPRKGETGGPVTLLFCY